LGRIEIGRSWRTSDARRRTGMTRRFWRTHRRTSEARRRTGMTRRFWRTHRRKGRRTGRWTGRFWRVRGVRRIRRTNDAGRIRRTRTWRWRFRTVRARFVFWADR
jgi:hypothetical protein